MTDHWQPGSARFQALLGAALRDYEIKAGVTLVDWKDEDWLAIRLQRCHTIDGITTLLQGRTQASDDIRQHHRIFKSIKATVSNLTPISALAYVDDGAGPVPVRQKVLKACLAFLTVFTEITPTYESDILYSRYPTGRMYHF